uniref:methyltransferase family protein n=1 Tax=Aquiluna sp. TaxID=2053504 RepID=UPI0040487E47
MNDRSRGYFYVAVQFLLIALLFTAPRQPEPYGAFSDVVGIVGVAVIALGAVILVTSFVRLGRSLTANPVPKEDGVLVTSGLYGRVRHPIYFGLLVLAFGVVLDAGWWPQIIIALMLYFLLNIKAQFEEDLLRKKYPEYKAYALKTPRFFPRIK